MITHAFDHLINAGIRKIIVNTHHCAEKYDEIFPDHQWRGVSLIFRHEPVLLETGGGIKNIEDLITEDHFVVYNGDVFSTLSLDALISDHLDRGHETTLAVRSNGGPLHLGVDAKHCVSSIRGEPNALNDSQHCLFTGIYLLKKSFFARLTAGKKESVIAAFLQMLRHGEPIGACLLDSGEWSDVGTLESYNELNQRLRTLP